MKKTIIFALLLAGLSAKAQEKSILLQGSLIDAFLQKPIVAKVSVYEMDSVTVVIDSAQVESIYGGRDDLLAVLFQASVKAGKHSWLVKATKDGYGDVWQKVTVKDDDAKVGVPQIKMRKTRTINLDEVVVTATKIKMFYRGDTLIYDATAFQLPEGSMLDDLIKQMPGLRMNEHGEIFVNERKVDELLLGSRSFLGGNKQVLMENLPYYTVKHIKVYDKQSDRSIALGYDADPKKYVMDVILKEEYQRGYIANVEAAGGTEERWLGRGFLLGFTDRYRFTLLGNANNVNETSHIKSSGHWTPAKMPRSLTTTRSVVAEIDYHSRGDMLQETFRAEYKSTDNTQQMRQSREQFLIGNPRSLTERTNTSNKWNVHLNNSFIMLTPVFLIMETRFDYGKRRGSFNSAFDQWGDKLTASMRSVGMSEGTTWSAYMSAVGSFNVGKEKSVTCVLDISHNSDKSESAARYDTRQFVTPSTEIRHNSGDISNIQTKGTLSINYEGDMLGLHLDAKNDLCLSRQKDHDWLYHPDTLQLASQLDALTAITDAGNSYDSRLSALDNTLDITLAKRATYLQNETSLEESTYDLLKLGVKMPVSRQSLSYQRGTLDTLVTRTTVFFNPWLSLAKIWKASRHEARFNVSHTRAAASLFDQITYRDDSNPLVVKLGNPTLKGTASSTASASYTNRSGHQNKNTISLGTSFTYRHRSVAQSSIYAPATGIYTYRPVNISGAYTASTKLTIARSIDKARRWTWQTNIDANYHHSIDHSMLVGETASHENAVNTLTLHDGVYIQYNKGALNVRATGDIRWRHNEGKMRDFSTLNAFDYQYGMSARYTIPGIKLTVAADATMYSRRGYGSASLNTDDFVINASISQPFMKGKLIARIEAFDLLHNLSSTQYEVNAQGRTETWYRSLPHYVMAHLVYHWNKNPKKK